MFLHDVGLVIIGRNEGERLVRCLQSIESYAENTVYVDSGSTDGSVSVAETAGICVVQLDTAQPFTAARARNRGFAALLTLRPNLQFVQFLDGDCELLGGWL